jgi:beta-lactamase regulating signal transducer with metallopeptidase domain
MIAAGVLAKGWLGLVGMMAVQGTILALVALAITRAGRLRPSWQAGIWLVVIAKLAVPWGPAMPWSLSDLIAGFSHHADAEAATWVAPALRPAVPEPSTWVAFAWVALASLWAIGAGIVLARAFVSHRRAVRAARSAPLAPPHVCALAPRVRVVIGDDAVGPHVVGMFRPTIVLPPALLADTALLRAALAHELAHVRRRDGFGRLLQVSSRALLFWFPVVRFAHRRLDLSREAACDAYALADTDVSRPAYARLLLRMAHLQHAAASELASPHALDARVAAVLGPPARAGLGAVHKLALAAWITLALGGARRAEAHSEKTVCKYTPQLAATLYASHPEADIDGDGALSRTEACELQAYLREHQTELASHLDVEAEAQLQTLLSEPLCCNCDPAGAYSTAEDVSCRSVEGVER